MIAWSGCWEDRTDRIICRWMVAYSVVDGVLSGCIGGYSGGGCFQLEKFVKNGEIFYIEADSNLSEIFNDDIINTAENCQDFVLLFHVQEAWQKSDNLILQKCFSEKFTKKNDLFYGGDELPAEFNIIFQQIGLISRLRN